MPTVAIKKILCLYEAREKMSLTCVWEHKHNTRRSKTADAGWKYPRNLNFSNFTTLTLCSVRWAKQHELTSIDVALIRRGKATKSTAIYWRVGNRVRYTSKFVSVALMLPPISEICSDDIRLPRARNYLSPAFFFVEAEWVYSTHCVHELWFMWLFCSFQLIASAKRKVYDRYIFCVMNLNSCRAHFKLQPSVEDSQDSLSAIVRVHELSSTWTERRDRNDVDNKISFISFPRLRSFVRSRFFFLHI